MVEENGVDQNTETRDSERDQISGTEPSDDDWCQDPVKMTITRGL